MARKWHPWGRLKVVWGRWIAHWEEDGHRGNKTLGKVRKMTKSPAKDDLAAIVNSCKDKCQTPRRDFRCEMAARENRPREDPTAVVQKSETPITGLPKRSVALP